MQWKGQAYARTKGWSISTHFLFPSSFREIIRELLLIHSRKDSHLSKIPKDTLYVIISFVSENVSLLPFETETTFKKFFPESFLKIFFQNEDQDTQIDTIRR